MENRVGLLDGLLPVLPRVVQQDQIHLQTKPLATLGHRPADAVGGEVRAAIHSSADLRGQ
jgi:hypothetical protein